MQKSGVGKTLVPAGILSTVVIVPGLCYGMAEVVQTVVMSGTLLKPATPLYLP